jgi:hypothetical protein
VFHGSVTGPRNVGAVIGPGHSGVVRSAGDIESI